MKFAPSTPDENFPLGRWLSEPSGRWELGFYPVLFGVRVRMGIAGEGCVEVDNCTGNNPDFLNEILKTMKLILLDVPEEISPGELNQIFPPAYRKPIYLDPIWPVLVVRAERAFDPKPGYTIPPRRFLPA